MDQRYKKNIQKIKDLCKRHKESDKGNKYFRKRCRLKIKSNRMKDRLQKEEILMGHMMYRLKR
jgi:hypothetical protein